MKKILIALTFSSLLLSCSNKEKTQNIDDLIKSNNSALMQARRTELQADLAKIDQALSKTETKKEEALVAVTTIKDTIFNHYLEVQGNVETKENILIQPEMPGALVSLNATAGQRVAKGQILGRVDDAGMSQQVASLETQYQLAKTTFERQKNLWNQKIGSEMQYLQAQTQMISLQKSVAQAKATLSKTLIRAPFSGTIDAVFVERGQVVSASPQGLMRIVNLSNMYIQTDVPETYIGKLKLGATVNVMLTSLNKSYVGRIRQVASNINAANRSFTIEIAVPNPDNLLRPNQVAKLQIIDYSNKKAISIPTNIILSNGNGSKYVYVADNVKGTTGVAKKVPVSVGQSSGNVTEIVSGLKAADVVVIEGINTLAEGTRLNF